MALFLVVAFVVMPLVELYVLIQVGHAIGVLPTIGLLLLVSFLGAWLVKREGVRTWQAFRLALREGRVPAKETADGALVILGGALLLAPGFVTDVLGAFCVLPPTRAVMRRLLTAVTVGRFAVVGHARDGAERVRKVRSRRMPADDRRPANEPRPPVLPPE
ncbi:MAG: protein FxsA [Frankiaceae bacterium]|nr:protein FxsA [Frankiaceae bacterium]